MSRLTCTALAVAAMLLFAAAAFAKTNTLKGTLKGESAATVSLQVTLNKKGEPTRVSHVSLKNAGFSCTDRSTGTLSVNIPGSAKVIKSTNSHGKTTFDFNMPFNPKTGAEFKGEANRRGTRVKGGVSYYYSKGEENVCGFFKVFTVTK